MAEEFMLTTVDNPFSPFTQYDSWRAFDENQGYYTNQFLARIVVDSDALSDGQEVAIINAAIDEIVRENVSGMHKKVRKSDY